MATTVASSAGNPDLDGDDGWISARIEALEPPDHVQLLPTGTADSLRVRVTGATDVNRDGPARLQDFARGDLIAIRLAPDGTAEKLNAFYHRLDDAVVTTRRGARMDTSQGPVVLDAGVETPDRFATGGARVPSKPLADIEAGDRVSMLGRYEADRQAFVAHYVRTE